MATKESEAATGNVSELHSTGATKTSDATMEGTPEQHLQSGEKKNEENTTTIDYSSIELWNFTCLLVNLGNSRVQKAKKKMKEEEEEEKEEEQEEQEEQEEEEQEEQEKEQEQEEEEEQEEQEEEKEEEEEASTLLSQNEPNPKGKRKYLKTAPIRKKLLEPIIKKHPDVIFLQEMKGNKRIMKELMCDLYEEISDDRVAVFLKKSKFKRVQCNDMPPNLSTDLREAYTEMKKEGHMKILFVKAVPLTRESDSILMASYHGRTRDSSHRPICDRKYSEIYTNLLKICEHWQEEQGARHMLIGGDFNTSETVVGHAINNAKKMLSIQAQSNTTPRREHKEVVDFFIKSKDLTCEFVEAQSFQNGVDQLDRYFDHDPILAKFRMWREGNSDILGSMIQHRNLVKAYYLSVHDLHWTHMTAILALLKTEDEQEWGRKSCKYLWGVLKSEQEMRSRFTEDDLRHILQYLNVPFNEEQNNLTGLIKILAQVYHKT